MTLEWEDITLELSVITSELSDITLNGIIKWNNIVIFKWYHIILNK